MENAAQIYDENCRLKAKIQMQARELKRLKNAYGETNSSDIPSAQEIETSITKTDIADWLSRTSLVDFYNEISKRVIGQDALKQVIGNVYLYLKNVSKGTPINNNMLLTAPSGCGKTETFRALQAYFKEKLPHLAFYLVDVSNVTSAGFRGQDANSILMPFYLQKNTNPIGIIFLDEFDKILTPAYDSSGMNVNRAVQSSFLTMVEGGKVSEKDRTVDTNNLMFVGLGSFDGFREKRSQKSRPLGFTNQSVDMFSDANLDADNKLHYKELSREDFVRAGASNELIGRFPYIVNYAPLTDEALNNVINKNVQTIINEFDLESLTLEDNFVAYLKSKTNSKFGCRLLDATIRDIVMKASNAANFSEPDKANTHQLSVNLISKDEFTYKWVSLESVNEFINCESNECNDDGSDDDGFEPLFW